MSTTIVHLIRHGEVFNPERILYGRIPDYHLSSRGHSMAARTASSFAGHDVSVLMSSPLERAQETAAPFAEKLGLEVRLDDRLLESGNRFEGLRVKGLRSQLWNPVRWPLMANPLLPSWGEHYVDQRDRMMAVVEDARRAAEGHEAILVSHQLPIVCVQRHIQGKPLAHNPAARQCNLASISSLVFEDDQLVDYIYTEPAQEI
ncbi:histidine phosphatase family protein [Corynebacterium pseudotuberculosis]|uniref:Histidine phosphatase family protein n=1 Tax=Corynebacterium pseudotuberculosis 258 TaxID=1168865 RepID=A0AAU8Q9F9_CORPS|nr:histidine phosphatase family protein [Corynebacterium pseudotuberculosis]AER68383.1 Phosphoglycerate mutase [Corynebacterium pseudotuberculosis 1/06-A]AEQ05847.1 histidine phosphatase family protein [Corynebacterium pseudotuberculosis CIP 52.97]AFB71622.1 histidine phosphatase family protein [Corynebacterium pseudotuberculosis 316]AFK15931.1 histidine phosphatase family protein [Corynebacterium pseudotuberculosis 258]AKS12630.1 Phosphoglycerate mutase [Corynebacterium pseudotuberculosis]